MNYIETATSSTVSHNVWQFHNIKVEESRFVEFRDAEDQQAMINQGVTQGWIIDLGTSTITFEE
jgi:hypothetical protein